MKQASQRALVVVITAAFATAIVGCSPKARVPADQIKTADLPLARVTKQQVPSTIDAVGTVHAKESAVLSAQVIGRVVSVPVHEGDVVHAGQVLVRLDDAAARADVDRAQASLAASQKQVEVASTQAALAASTLGRYRLLRERRSVSPQEFDEVENRSQAAAAQLEAARAELAAAQAAAAGAHTAAGYSVITAPFAGIVTARRVDPGALASPGAPLIEVDRAGSLQLHVTVDEAALPNLQAGRAIPVNVPSALQQPLEGHVAQIVPAADVASHTFLVKIDLPTSKALRAGMYGTASVGSGTRTALMLPASALVAHGSLNTVWVLDGRDVASIRYVTLGARNGEFVEALSGLSEGETVVLSAGDRELAGVRITGAASEARP